MRLKNKKTGEIKELQGIMSDMIDNHIVPTLIAIENEWEDYEELVGYWYVSEQGIPGRINFSWDSKESIENHKEIGNYFETYEEAEKVVEKLMAWKRLKDKGFRFCGHDDRDRGQLGDIVIYAEMPTFEYDDDSTRDDLDLLFGGEE